MPRYYVQTLLWVARVSIACFWVWSATVIAGEQHQPVYDQYSLQASAESEVVNDRMLVRMQVEHEDRDAAALAGKVNADMQWALDQLGAAEYESIQVKTENYSTYPKYEQNRVVGWRSVQMLALSGGDFDAIKAAVQILQGRLQVQSMSFKPSDETRRQMEDALINTALDNMKHRAKIVQENMGASGFRIMHLNIDTGHRYAGRARMETSMMRSASVESAPAVDGGESTLSVTVSGQIQLQ